MIRSFLSFQWRPWPLISGLPGFSLQWLRSRPASALLAGLPALAVTVLIVWATVSTRLPSARARLGLSYLKRATAAAEAGQLQQAEILYRRAIPWSPDRRAVTVAFAKDLLRLGEEARAVRMLTAEASFDGAGYDAAHAALADYYAKHPDQNPTHQAFALRHRLAADSDDLDTRLQLVELLAQHQAWTLAIQFLQPVADKDPRHQLLLSRLLAADGKTRQSREVRAAADANLQQAVQANPDSDELRQLLIGSLAEQGLLFDALTAALEGCSQPMDPETVDTVINVYAAWMSTLPRHAIPAQLRSLRMTIDPAADPEQTYRLASITRADGSVQDVHECFAGIHSILSSPDSQWLVDLLRGTAAIGDEQYHLAVQLLQAAHQQRPRHPVIANNLAWAMLQTVEHVAQQERQTLLAEALQLAALAVESGAEFGPFYDTQAEILVALQDWSRAEAAMQRCIDLGYDPPDLFARLKLVREQLSVDVESQSDSPDVETTPAAN